MKKKKIKAEYLLIVALLLVGGGAGGVLLRPAGEPDMVISSRMGDVIWNHDFHARMDKSKVSGCVACHHEMRGSEAWEGKWGFGKPGMTQAKACRDCHPQIPGQYDVFNGKMFALNRPAPKEGVQSKVYAPEAFHGVCQGCHKALGKGPVGCRDCHAQRFSGKHGMVQWDHRQHSRFMDLECEYCHHQAKGKNFKDADYRPCSQCHKPAKEMGIKMLIDVPEHMGIDPDELQHEKCSSCHVETDPEEGVTDCRSCHTGMKKAEKGDPPSIEQVLHKRCLECHNVNYDEIEDGMPLLCKECHKPNPSIMDGGTAGPVMWSHIRHNTFTDNACLDCHRSDVAGIDEPQLACNRCHSTDHFAGLPPLKETLHKNCTECHSQTRGDTGPLWVDDCGACHAKEGLPGIFKVKLTDWQGMFDHQFHAVDLAFSCRECHHNMINNEGLFYTGCTVAWMCKDKPEVGNPIKCKSCHEDNGPGPLALEIKSNVRTWYQQSMDDTCKTCHKDLGVEFPVPEEQK